MADEAGVMDAAEVEVDDGLGEVEEGLEAEVAAEPVEGGAEQAETAEASEFTTKFGREYRAWLNGLKQTNPEAAKFIKQARDDYGRAFAIQQIDKRGIDGIRERHALLDSLVLGDAKGTEAITAMQERLAQTDEVDTLLAAGDPRALESLGDDFNPGLAKLAPAILDRVAQSDPAAYEAALAPHLVGTLSKSPMIGDFNAMVDALKEAPPSYLTPEQKSHWTAERLQRVVGHVSKMAEWFNGLGSKAAEFKAQPVDKAKTEFEAERTKFEQEKQEAHWNTNIKPAAATYENAKFEELFKPYNLRLKLDAGAKQDLMQAFKSALNRAGSTDQEYLRQMKIYRGQKNPDAAAVTNYVKNAINKHSKTAMESLVKARYGSFLAGKPRTQQVVKPGGKPQGAVGPNVEVRTVKPANEDIDFQKTGRDGVWNNRFVLKNGKTVQVRPA